MISVPFNRISKLFFDGKKETLKPKRYIFRLMLKNECQNDVLTYLRKALQNLHTHFASNCCQVASCLNAQPLCIETWVRDKNTWVTWKKLIPEDSTSQSRKEVKEFEIYSLTIYSQKNIFWLGYQQLREKLFRIIYPKWTSWFRSYRNLYERYQLFGLIV